MSRHSSNRRLPLRSVRFPSQRRADSNLLENSPPHDGALRHSRDGEILGVPDGGRRSGWLFRDPAAPSLLLFGSLVLAGLVAIWFGYRTAAATLFVPFQVPALVSGGVGGLLLVLLGVGLTNAQLGRRLAAEERIAMEAVLDEAAGLLAATKRRFG
jgi:hypothetical protein